MLSEQDIAAAKVCPNCGATMTVMHLRENWMCLRAARESMARLNDVKDAIFRLENIISIAIGGGGIAYVYEADPENRKRCQCGLYDKYYARKVDHRCAIWKE